MTTINNHPQPKQQQQQSSLTAINSIDIRNLLKLFSSTNYRPKDTNKRIETIESTCFTLFAKDYPDYVVINNENGELSNSYPSMMFIPDKTNDFVPCLSRANTLTDPVPYQKTTSTVNNNNNNDNDRLSTNGSTANGSRRLDIDKLKNLISHARVARCRARFPIPVMLCRNKYICRSATLSSGAEIYGRSVFDYCTNNDLQSTSGNNVVANSKYVRTNEVDDDFVETISLEESPPLPRSLTIGDSSQLFSKVRNQDIKLLKYFSVKHICDLMLEMKKVKFGLNVTSSEKADKENRYSDFNIISLPYPGCEFFREYRDNNYCAEGLIYNWNQNFVDAMLDLPKNTEMLLTERLQINFNDYQQWDVVKLTQNYIKLLLYHIKEFDSSILIHCISGWDRTPLFISLLRLTLWADGEIHHSLSPAEIIYLTVAYDWFLFGHNLSDRLNKGEEIMFFCFQFLKFITDEQYSINYEHTQAKTMAPTAPTTMINNETEINTRKISVDSYTNGDDFLLESTIDQTFGGSLTSLNSNCSFPNNIDPATYYSVINTQKCSESEIMTGSSLSPIIDIEKLKIDSDDINPIQDSMMSTLTSSCELNNLKCTTTKRPSPIDHSHMSTYKSGSLAHSPSKPMEIPNSRDKSNNIDSMNSLCRSDSWQFVSEAGSIRESNLSNQFSSPDSITSIRSKDSKDANGATNSPLFSTANLNNSYFTFGSTTDSSNSVGQQRHSRRKKSLLEARSIFNSAYTSLNLNLNNGCRITNLVDHFVGPFYSTNSRETPE